MGERKVLNKYYPPDFDPAKLPRGKRPEHNSMKVRMMLPMSVQCKTCGTFMYKGTKFNMKKEDCQNETYLGIQIFRFYWRCSACAAEITMKTDPQNADYSMEIGATRNYEPWREKEEVKILNKAQREEEERGNAMKALENRTLDSKREMDIMTALDELQSLNARHHGVTADQALAAIKRSGNITPEDDLAVEDEELIRQMLFQSRSRRLEEPEEEEEEEELAQPGTSQPAAVNGHAGPTDILDSRPDPAETQQHQQPAGPRKPGSFGVQPRSAKFVVIKRKPEAPAAVPEDVVRRKTEASDQAAAGGHATANGGAQNGKAGEGSEGALMGLGGYGSSGSGSD